jgi:phytoene synthase
MATNDLRETYAVCARLTRRYARNFYYAFASLPRRQRMAVYALYAFCREADDVADGADVVGTPSAGEKVFDALSVGAAGEGAPLDARREAIASLRDRLAAAAEGRPRIPRDLALADAIDRYGVSPDDLGDVLTGMEMDLTRTRYATFDDLREYCYHVASAAGLATLPVLSDGVPPTDAMRERAIELGLGMQLVNVLRDVAEDIERDRVYLPQDEIARFGVDPATLARGEMTEPLRLLLALQAARAREYLANGRRLTESLPRRGRACPWLLAEIYRRILERIIAVDYDVFAGRVSLSTREKLALLATARWRAR